MHGEVLPGLQWGRDGLEMAEVVGPGGGRSPVQNGVLALSTKPCRSRQEGKVKKTPKRIRTV